MQVLDRIVEIVLRVSAHRLEISLRHDIVLRKRHFLLSDCIPLILIALKIIRLTFELASYLELPFMSHQLTSDWLCVYIVLNVRGVGLELASGKNFIMRIDRFLRPDSIFAEVLVVSVVAGLKGELILWENVVLIDDVVACYCGAWNSFPFLSECRIPLDIIAA